jgi:hypothetical protein
MSHFTNLDYFVYTSIFLQWLTLSLFYLFSGASARELICNQKYYQYESHKTKKNAKSEIDVVSDTQTELNFLFIYVPLDLCTGVKFPSQASPDELTVNIWYSPGSNKLSS